MDSLDAAFDKAFKEIDRRLADIVTETASAMFRFLRIDALNVGSAFGSPVLTGRFISSHRISLNFPDYSTEPVNAEDEQYVMPSEAETLTPVVRDYKLGDTIYIANALDYADILEEINPSRKAPRGVYEVTAQFTAVTITNSYRSGGIAG